MSRSAKFKCHGCGAIHVFKQTDEDEFEVFFEGSKKNDGEEIEGEPDNGKRRSSIDRFFDWIESDRSGESED